MESKKIKVLYSHRTSKNNYWCSNKDTIIPKISMEGKWLEALGFNIGDQLQVEYAEGEIHIRPIKTKATLPMVCEDSEPFSTAKAKSKDFKSQR